MEFTNEQKGELLTLVHDTLNFYFEQGREPKFTTENSAYLAPAGAFVTLYKGDQLRGCIGHTQADRLLYDVVQEMAVAAATIDPRFLPVTKNELPTIHVEISVLSQLFPIIVEEVEVGVHGLLLEYGGQRGLLLPRVPVEYGWDKETYLTHLCMKAGLPTDIWARNPKLSAFTACEFGEKDVKGSDCA